MATYISPTLIDAVAAGFGVWGIRFEFKSRVQLAYTCTTFRARLHPLIGMTVTSRLIVQYVLEHHWIGILAYGPSLDILGTITESLIVTNLAGARAKVT